MPLPTFGVGRESRGANDLSRGDCEASQRRSSSLLSARCGARPNTAAKWLDRFETALESLAIHLERFALVPENHLGKETIRQSFFGQRVGRFRVLFTIRDEDVIVLHIRRGAMNKATAEDLDLP